SAGNKGKVTVLVESKNLIPFEYSFVICTENNMVVSGIQTSMAKLYPNQHQNVFRFEEDIQLDRVRNGYLELRFRYESLSYEELHLQGHAGKITSAYRLTADQTALYNLSRLSETSEP